MVGRQQFTGASEEKPSPMRDETMNCRYSRREKHVCLVGMSSKVGGWEAECEDRVVPQSVDR